MSMVQLSTENLNLLPNPAELKKICKSIAALEAIICQDWEFRYYSFQKEWSENEEFCEMRNGEGDQLLISFGKNGTCINGFAHESKINGWQKDSKQEIPAGVVDELPAVFNDFIFGEPVKSIGTTFCIWQTKTDENWKTGKIKLPNDDYKDGSSDLLQLLDGNPLTYKNWAEEYYEENFEDSELALELVEHIYNGAIITKEMILKINPELEDFEQLKSDLDEIGYAHKL